MGSLHVFDHEYKKEEPYLLFFIFISRKRAQQKPLHKLQKSHTQVPTLHIPIPHKYPQSSRQPPACLNRVFLSLPKEPRVPTYLRRVVLRILHRPTLPATAVTPLSAFAEWFSLTLFKKLLQSRSVTVGETYQVKDELWIYTMTRGRMRGDLGIPSGVLSR